MAGKEIQFKSGDGSSNVGGDLKLTAGAGNGENKKGGDLVLSTGISTGNQSAAITLLTSVSGDTGEDDRDPAERMRIHTNGYVGIGTNAPGTLLQLEGADAYITLKNTSDEHGNGEAETKIIFEDHGNNILAQIQASHDGTDDDCKGDLILSTNNGSNATSLITALTINSLQYVGIGTSDPLVKLEIRSDATQLRLTDNSDSSRYADIFQNDGHFTLKTYNSSSDIVLDTKGNDIQLHGNGTFFGGLAKNNNNLLLYSQITNKSITFKTSVTGSLTKILELNKTNNLSTFDSNIKLNGSMIYNNNSASKSSSFSIDFESSSSGDYVFTIDPSTSSYTISYDEISSSNNVGKKGTIIFKRGSLSGDAPKLAFNTSMTSPSRSWVGHHGDTIHLQNTGDLAIYEYQIIEQTTVLLKSITNTQFTSTIVATTSSIEIDFNTIPNGYVEYSISNSTTYTVSYSSLESSIVGKSGRIIFKLSEGGTAPTLNFSTSMSGRYWNASFGSMSSPYLELTNQRGILEYIILDSSNVYINLLADGVKPIS